MEGKSTILFDEYKRGFGEIQKLVGEFEGMSNGSQKLFLQTREGLLKQQLDVIQQQRDEVHVKIKRFLVEANSDLVSLLDLENFVQEEIQKCKDMQQIIDVKEVMKSQDQAAV